MATTYWYDEAADFSSTYYTWVSVSNGPWVHEADYNGWDAPTN